MCLHVNCTCAIVRIWLKFTKKRPRLRLGVWTVSHSVGWTRDLSLTAAEVLCPFLFPWVAVDSKESGWSYIFVVVYGADARRWERIEKYQLIEVRWLRPRLNSLSPNPCTSVQATNTDKNHSGLWLLYMHSKPWWEEWSESIVCWLYRHGASHCFILGVLRMHVGNWISSPDSLACN